METANFTSDDLVQTTSTVVGATGSGFVPDVGLNATPTASASRGSEGTASSEAAGSSSTSGSRSASSGGPSASQSAAASGGTSGGALAAQGGGAVVLGAALVAALLQ